MRCDWLGSEPDQSVTAFNVNGLLQHLSELQFKDPKVSYQLV